eukprot:12959-Heterococcus_DN1.PRE.1
MPIEMGAALGGSGTGNGNGSPNGSRSPQSVRSSLRPAQGRAGKVLQGSVLEGHGDDHSDAAAAAAAVAASARTAASDADADGCGDGSVVVTSVLCIKCRRALDDLSNIKELSCAASLGYRPPRPVAWVRTVMRAVVRGKVWDDAVLRFQQ